MIDDPIVAEVRQAREQHTARFNFDLEAIYQDLKEQEASGGRQVMAFPPRKRHHTRTAPHLKQRPSPLAQ